MFLKDNTLLIDLLKPVKKRPHNTNVNSCRGLFTDYSAMPQTIDVETGKHGQQYAWSEKEMCSLVEFVALYWDHADKSTHWPKHRVKEFWGKCAIYVAESSKKVKQAYLGSYEK